MFSPFSRVCVCVCVRVCECVWCVPLLMPCVRNKTSRKPDKLFLSPQVTSACKKFGGFYLGSIGGPAAILAQNCIKKVEVLEYPELGNC